MGKSNDFLQPGDPLVLKAIPRPRSILRDHLTMSLSWTKAVKAWRIWIRAWQKAGVADSTEFALRKAFCLPPSGYPSFGYAFSTDADSVAAIYVLVQIDAR